MARWRRARHDSTMKRLVIGWVLGAAALGGYLVYTQIDEPADGTTFCAGVGLTGPEAASPRAALDAYLAEVGGTPSDWKQTERAFSSGSDFSRIGKRSPQPDVAVVIVERAG